MQTDSPNPHPKAGVTTPSPEMPFPPTPPLDTTSGPTAHLPDSSAAPKSPSNAPSSVDRCESSTTTTTTTVTLGVPSPPRNLLGELTPQELTLLNAWIDEEFSLSQLAGLCLEHFNLHTNRTALWRYKERRHLLDPDRQGPADSAAEISAWAANTRAAPNFSSATLLLLKKRAFESAGKNRLGKKFQRLFRLILSTENYSLRRENLEFQKDLASKKEALRVKAEEEARAEAERLRLEDERARTVAAEKRVYDPILLMPWFNRVRFGYEPRSPGMVLPPEVFDIDNQRMPYPCPICQPPQTPEAEAHLRNFLPQYHQHRRKEWRACPDHSRFHTMCFLCPCGHKLPCPHHTFPHEFWKISPDSPFYRQILTSLGFPDLLPPPLAGRSSHPT